jgi:hypothetical protein
MHKCCDRAHKKGLSVVYITSEEEFRAEYPVREMASLDDVARLVACLLHPGKKEKTDLLVLDSITHMVPENRGTMVVAESARRWGRLFSSGFGQTAVVGTFQARRESTRPSAEMGHQANVILSVSNSNSTYTVELVKSKVSAAGVSCEADLKGSSHHNSRLTEGVVRQVRSKLEVMSGVEVAKEFGVAPQTVYDIKKGSTWSHV